MIRATEVPSTITPASLKRRHPEDTLALSAGNFSANKKNQAQREFQELVAKTAVTDEKLGSMCKRVLSILKELNLRTERTDADNIQELLELSVLKGIEKFETNDDHFDREVEPNIIKELVAEIKDEPIGKQLEALNEMAKNLVEAFGLVNKEVENHEEELTKRIDQYEAIYRQVVDSKHAAEDALNAAVQRFESFTSNNARLDRELESIILKNQQRGGKGLSAMLDVLQSGDAQITQLMQERRQVSEMQKLAREEFELRSKELDYRKALFAYCEEAGGRMDDELNRSRMRGYNNRCPITESLFALVRELVERQEIVISQFGRLQLEREQVANDKLAKIRSELEAHKRLYGEDEAKTERKDLEGRADEFNEIARRSKASVQECVSAQVAVWTGDGVPEQVKRFVMAKLGPVLRSLPFQDSLNMGFFKTEQSLALVQPATTTALVVSASKAILAAPGYDSDGFFDTDDDLSSASSAPKPPARALLKDAPSVKEDTELTPYSSIVAAEQQRLSDDASSSSSGGCAIM